MSKPMKNFSHLTPQALATRKWPSSWTKMTAPKARATFSITSKPAGVRSQGRPAIRHIPIVIPLVAPSDPARSDRSRVGCASKSCESSTLRQAGTISVKCSSPSKKLSTAASFAAFNTAPVVPPLRAHKWPNSRAGKRSGSGGSKSSRQGACQSSRSAMPGWRFGYSSAYWIGSFMSGGPSWATIEPSTNSTSEWTIDWRWRRT